MLRVEIITIVFEFKYSLAVRLLVTRLSSDRNGFDIARNSTSRITIVSNML